MWKYCIHLDKLVLEHIMPHCPTFPLLWWSQHRIWDTPLFHLLGLLYNPFNLLSFIFNTFIQNSTHLLFASHTNGIILISYILLIALLWCSLPTPKKILVAHNCTWTSGSVWLQHPRTSAQYSNTKSTKACNNIIKVSPSPHQWLFYISSAVHKGLLLPLLLSIYTSPLPYTLHIRARIMHPKYLRILHPILNSLPHWQ